MKKLGVSFLVCALPLFGQGTNGELRLRAVDPSGVRVKANAQITSEAKVPTQSGFLQSLKTKLTGCHSK